ncbi:hypothetical protein HQ496_12205 [bacterium]|nr:hypothetical protein [bacterium]
MKRTVLLFFFLFVAQGTTGQSLIAFAPWEFGIGTSFQADLDTQTALLSAKRVVPVATLLPQVTGDSHLEVLGLSAGARWINGSYDRIRFRITAAQIALQRAYTSGGLTLIDYNQSGIRKQETTWLGVSFGPGFHLQRPGHSLWLRVLGTSSLSSIENGILLFPGSKAGIETGLLFSVAAQSGVSLTNKVMVEASIERQTMPEADLKKQEVAIQLSYHPTTRLFLTTGFSQFDFDLGPDSNDFSGWNVSLRFKPGQAGF